MDLVRISGVPGSRHDERIPLVIMADDEFNALVIRLERASDVLRNAGCLVQAVSRRYYLVYAYARQAAEKHSVAFRRGVQLDGERRFTHQALPSVIQALYSGQNRGAVLGGGPRRNSDWAIDRRRGLPQRSMNDCPGPTTSSRT